MPKLHHIGITVSDTDTAVTFYREITKVEPIGPLMKSGPAVEAATGHPGVTVVLTFLPFADGETVIELAEYRDGPGGSIRPDTGFVGVSHPAIVVDDIDAMLTRLDALGYRSLSEPMIGTSGPLEGYRYVYVLGPDELRVELLEEPR